MHNIAQPLRRTLSACAAHRNAVFISHDRSAAFRADGRHSESNSVIRALVFIDREHLRNNFPCLLYQNRITDADIQIPSVIKCVPIRDVDARFNTVLIYRKGRIFNQYEEAFINMLFSLYGKYFGTENDRGKLNK